MQLRQELELANKEDFNKCFCCGKDNPIGLKLMFHREGEEVLADFTASQYHQGWPGVVHGGVIATVMDEAMNYASYFEGLHCVTGKMEVRFRQPLSVGCPVQVSAIIRRKNRKVVESKAKVVTEDGVVVAEGTALMYIVDEEPPERSTDGEDTGSSQT